MNKWEVDEHEQWSEKVRINAFDRTCQTKTETMKGYDQIKENRSLSPWGWMRKRFDGLD